MKRKAAPAKESPSVTESLSFDGMNEQERIDFIERVWCAYINRYAGWQRFDGSAYWYMTQACKKFGTDFTKLDVAKYPYTIRATKGDIFYKKP
jgi:hypothetical protein